MDVVSFIAPGPTRPAGAPRPYTARPSGLSRGSESPSGRILLVEDERIIARELKERLTQMGHTVVGSVATGEEAVEQVRALKPNLVLMDIKLQGPMDGIDAAEIIHREADVPVVYLTAFTDDDTLQRAKLTEPYGYVLKPFQDRELHLTVEMSLHRHRAERHRREQQAFRDAVLQSASDAIIACGVDDRVKLMNRMAERLTGWTTVEALGQPVDQILRVREDPGPATDPKGHRRHELSARDGSVRHVELELAVVRDEAGVVLGSVRVVRDVPARP